MIMVSLNCTSQWGLTINKKTVLLWLEFKDPIASKILITFDIVKYGVVVDQIIYAQCMYLMTGTSETKISENLNKNKILLEIPIEGFADEWKHIYREMYVKYIRKKYQKSRKEANEIFTEMQKKMKSIKTLRMK